MDNRASQQAAQQQILALAQQPRRRAPAPLYLFGLFWIVLALVAVMGVEMPWARPLIYFSLGMMLLYLGALVSERHRMERSFGELLEAFESFNRSIYGDKYKVKRAAVDILIRTLSSEDASVRARAHEQLRRLSGKDYPAQAEAWQSWWQDARASFTGEPSR